MLGLGLATHKNNVPMKNIVKDGLVLWLDGRDFKNSPPTTSWIDKSGNGNNAVPYNLAYSTTSGNDGNSGVLLDGVDDYILLPSSLSFPSSNFTIITVVTLSMITDTYRGVLGSRVSRSANRGGYSFRIESDKLIVSVSDGNGTIGTDKSIASSINVTDNVKRLYALVVNRETNIMKLYINGIQNGSDLSILGLGLINNSATPAIGSMGSSTLVSPQKNFHTLMYNRALSDLEILKNYNALK